jgi:serine protease Do
MVADRARSDSADEPWRVRVRSRGEPWRILGAGVLLGREHVLTCAHVAQAEEDLVVDLVGLEGIPSSAARITDGMCVPPMKDGLRGDVALLVLATPQPYGIGATLRRVALTWDRPVRTFGYPAGLELGVWTRLTLAGRAGVEWLQMNRRSRDEQRVRAGFSGAGVVDETTRGVLGIVVSEYTDDAAGLSWMLPVEAIGTYLPRISEWVVGDSGIDPVLTPRVPDAGRARAVDAIADWLDRRDEGAAVLIVVGSDIDAVRQAVFLSSTPTASLGTRGMVDLALDVGGLSVEQVSHRIIHRAGLAEVGTTGAAERVRANAPPMTIVADGVDEAERPESLLDEVFKPLVDSGARLVLGFRHDDSASLAMARSLAADLVANRLDGFTERITKLIEAGRLRKAGPVVSRAADLRLRLSMLRRAATENSALVADRLVGFERRLAMAEHDLADADHRADAVAADEGLLDAAKAKAAAGGLAEHLGLAALHDSAVALLSADPVDQALAHAAVLAYLDAVRRELDGGGRA